MLTRSMVEKRTNFFRDNYTTEYNYDASGQLTSTLNPESVENESFTYDELGNRTSGNTTFDVTRQKLQEDWKYLYYYDQNGNLSSKTEKSNGDLHQYNYNSLNQLVEYQFFKGGTLKELEAFYTYDAIGRRVEKHVNDIKSSKTTIRRYVYDGSDLLAIYDKNGNRLAKYTYSGTRLDDVLSVDITNAGKAAGLAKNDGSFFYLKDHVGSIIDITNNEGKIIQHYVYSSFGKLKGIQDNDGIDISSSPVVSPYLTFTGREYDKESNSYFFRARNYDSHTGRFFQQDPIQGDVANPLTVTNKYIYSLNNPINRVDPTGEISFKQIIGISLALVFPLVSLTTDFFEDNFDLTDSQIKTINNIHITAAITAAAYFTGGAAGGAASSALGGALMGGLAGGLVGGVVSTALGRGFKSGFISGFLVGMMAGYSAANAQNASSSGTEASSTASTKASTGADTQQVLNGDKVAFNNGPTKNLRYKYNYGVGGRGGYGLTPRGEAYMQAIEAGADAVKGLWEAVKQIQILPAGGTSAIYRGVECAILVYAYGYYCA